MNYLNLPTDNSDFTAEENEQDILRSLHEEPMFDFGDVIMPRPFTEFVKAEVEEGHAGAADNNDGVNVGVPPVDAQAETAAEMEMDFIMEMGHNSAEATCQIRARRISLFAVPNTEGTSPELPSCSYNQAQVQSSLISGIRRSSYPIPNAILSSSASSSQVQGPRPPNSSINVSYLFDGLQYKVRKDITRIQILLSNS